MKWFRMSPSADVSAPSKDEFLDDLEEVATLKALLDDTLDAKLFTTVAQLQGFRFVEEGAMGLKMESDRGRFMLGVLGSVHETNIATLVYLDKASNRSVCLVDGGRRQY